MVPQPEPYTAPRDPRMSADPTAHLTLDKPLAPLPFLRNTSGRPWKTAHLATVRSQKSDKGTASANWDKRQEARKKEDAVKKLERDMKEEVKNEVERKRAITKERQVKLAEKKRLEEMATRMSARKLQRMKKRLGRTKKINA